MSKIIKLTKRDLDKAMDFTKNRCEEKQDLYRMRGGFKSVDILVGALAEIGVYKLLKNYDFNVSKPDFSIHEKKNKSYNSDLFGDDKHFHVKGQSMSSMRRYGASWLLQRHDPMINAPEQSHYIVPCVVDDDNLEVEVYGIVPVRTLVNMGCFGECKVPSFRSTKVALYKDYMDCVLTSNSLWGILYRR